MSNVDAVTTEWLKNEIDRHRTWRRIWSITYSTSVAITIIAGAAATASAGLTQDYEHGALLTALLAGAATVFASLEKVLRLREKWDLHRNIQVALEMVYLNVSSGLIDARKTLELIEKTAQMYSMQLAELNAEADENST